MRNGSRHVTPDGQFTLVHDAADDDVIGFEGYSWHTHRELLDALDTDPEIQTMPQLVEALQQRRLVLAVSRINGRIEDVWFTDDPVSELPNAEQGATLELRY